MVKEPLTKQETSDLWVEKIPWRRSWQPTPVFLPGKSHRQRSLVGYSPWGCKESDTYVHTCYKGEIRQPSEWLIKPTKNGCHGLLNRKGFWDMFVFKFESSEPQSCSGRRERRDIMTFAYFIFSTPSNYRPCTHSTDIQQQFLELLLCGPIEGVWRKIQQIDVLSSSVVSSSLQSHGL